MRLIAIIPICACPSGLSVEPLPLSPSLLLSFSPSLPSSSLRLSLVPSCHTCVLPPLTRSVEHTARALTAHGKIFDTCGYLAVHVYAQGYLAVHAATPSRQAQAGYTVETYGYLAVHVELVCVARVRDDLEKSPVSIELPAPCNIHLMHS
jgi:hypothetical protein